MSRTDDLSSSKVEEAEVDAGGTDVGSGKRDTTLSFVGEWVMVRQEGWDAFGKAYGVPWLLRKLASAGGISLTVTQEGVEVTEVVHAVAGKSSTMTFIIDGPEWTFKDVMGASISGVVKREVTDALIATAKRLKDGAAITVRKEYDGQLQKETTTCNGTKLVRWYQRK